MIKWICSRWILEERGYRDLEISGVFLLIESGIVLLIVWLGFFVLFMLGLWGV